jgi:hypothetical protein
MAGVLSIGEGFIYLAKYFKQDISNKTFQSRHFNQDTLNQDTSNQGNNCHVTTVPF